MDSKKNAPTPSSRDFRKEVVVIHKSAQADSKKKVDSNNDYSASAECMDCHATASAVSRNDEKNAQTLESSFENNAPFLSLRALAQDKAWRSITTFSFGALATAASSP